MRISGRRFVAILLSLAGHCRKDVFQIGKLPVFTKAKRPECQNSVVLYMINTLICLRNELFFSFLFFFWWNLSARGHALRRRHCRLVVGIFAPWGSSDVRVRYCRCQSNHRGAMLLHAGVL